MARATRRKSRLAPAGFARDIDRRRAAILVVGAATSALLAWNAAAFALVSAARSGNVSLASRLGDPSSQLTSLQQQATTKPDRLLAPDVAALAQNALRADPLNSGALRILALRAAGNAREAEAKKLALLAETVSRRDLLTQLFLIEDAVKAEDHKLALQHYDVALRTKSGARSILFPILSGALSDDAVRAAVVPYVRHRVNWMREFVEFAVRDGVDGPRRIGMLLVQSGAGRQTDLMRTSGATLIGGLTDRGQFELAGRLYAQMPNASPALLKDTAFTPATTDPKIGTFAWTTFSEAASGATFETAGGDKQRQLRAFAGSNEAGTVVRRAMRLDPGAYRLSEQRARVVDDSSATAYWQMKCAQGTAQPVIWTGPKQPLAYTVVNAAGPVIPAACPNQFVELVIAGGTGQEGMEVLIKRFALTR